MKGLVHMDVLNILQAVYYTLVIIGAAFGVSKAVGLSLRSASKAMAESTTSILESHGNIIKNLTVLESEVGHCKSRISQLENHQQTNTRNFDEFKEIMAAMSGRIDKIFELLTKDKK